LCSANDRVHVRRVRLDAKIARRAALDVQERRVIEARRDPVELITPARQGTFGTKRIGDGRDCLGPGPLVFQRWCELDAIGIDTEHVGTKPREPLRARVVDVPDRHIGDDERSQPNCRWRERAIEPPVDCR